jgi:tetratricopeptide (TPR) repeat protein/predicted transcriptional regulator
VTYNIRGTTVSSNLTARELLATIAQRRAFLKRILESEEPTDKQTLIDALDQSRSTVNRVSRELCDRGLLRETDGLTPTLLASLAWEAYRTFDRRVAAIETTEADAALPWRTVTERWEAMQLIADRYDLLACMATAPREKCDIVAGVSSSRSTVNRAIRELEMAGLVVRTSAGYTTLPAVRRATTEYHAAVERVNDILDVRDIIAGFSPDCPIETALLTDSTVECTADAPPYHLPAGVCEQFTTAERVRMFLPALATPQLLDCCHRGVIQDGLVLELVTTSDLFENLTTEFPGPLAAMTADRGGSFTACVADNASTSPPPFGLIIAEGTTTTVSVITYGEKRTIQGMIHNATDDAVQWAEECYAHIRDEASIVTSHLHDLTPAGTGPVSIASDGSAERIARETEGIVQLTPEYFAQRAPASPMTSWRTGLDLVDVHAGYAVDRETERDGTRSNLTVDLTERLSDGTNHAVIGPPGSGKSTVCKTVACNWYEHGLGPVFYRTSDGGPSFDSPAVLEAQLRTAAATGHVLVVIEDAVRAAANAIFRVMQAFRGNPNVTFLLDAREDEWTDPEALPIDAGLEAYRSEAIETITVPPLDDTEAARFTQQFERIVDHEIDSTITQQFRKNWVADTDSSGGDADSSGEGQSSSETPIASYPGELLLFLHRLVLTVDPLPAYDTTMPTKLVEDVQRTYERLREAGERALDVGVLVNLLNATGIGVSPSLVCVLAERDDAEYSIDAIRDELSSLEGRMIFEHGVDAEPGQYQTVHEEWSVLFLEYFRETTTERAASQRFGRCITALLSLADEPKRRERITAAFGGTAPAIERIADAPEEWADAVIEQLFSLGLRRRDLAPLFGRTDDSAIDVPDACSSSTMIDCTRWRAQMAIEAGDLDRAEHEYETLSDLADDVTDPDRAMTLRGQRLNGLGVVAWRRSEFDTAETYYTRALEQYCETDDTRRAETRMNLGVVACNRGDLTSAEVYYRESLDMYRDLEHMSKAILVLFNLGSVLAVTDSLTTTIEHYRECLDHYRDIGDRRREALCLADLGFTIADSGDFDEAETYCAQALELCRETGAQDFEAYCLEYIGRVNRLRGDFDTAETYYQQSLSIRREIGDRRAEARSLTACGLLARKRGDLATAVEYCTMSHEICKNTDSRREEAKNIAVIGEIAHKRGEPDTAAEHARDSLSIYQEIGDIPGTARCHRLLGQVACDRGQFTTAEDNLTQALTSLRDTGYRYEAARTLVALAVLDRRRNELPSARERLETAVAEHRAIGAIHDAVETGTQLTAVCESMGMLDDALEHCEAIRTLAQNTDFVDCASLNERQDRIEARVHESESVDWA